MANVTTGITRRDALTKVWEFAKDNGILEMTENAEGLEQTINNMLKALAPKSSKTGESTATKQNRATLAELMDKVILSGASGITAREFAKELPWTTDKAPVQKATRILVQGVNEGILETVMPEKKSQPMRYRYKVTQPTEE